MDAVLAFLTANGAEILVGFGLTIRLAEWAAKLTKTTTDDVIVAAIDKLGSALLGRR